MGRLFITNESQVRRVGEAVVDPVAGRVRRETVASTRSLLYPLTTQLFSNRKQFTRGPFGVRDTAGGGRRITETTGRRPRPVQIPLCARFVGGDWSVGHPIRMKGYRDSPGWIDGPDTHPDRVTVRSVW
jgi:hypothetical protein